jgi:hypothetical protein
MYDPIAHILELAEKVRKHIGDDDPGPDTDDPVETAFYWLERYCESRGYTYYSRYQSDKPTLTKLAERGWFRRWRVPSMVDTNRRAPMPKEDSLAHDPVARAARRICIDDTLVKTPEELLEAAEQEASQGGLDTADLPASKEELYEHLVKIAPALQSRYMFLDEWKWRELGREWCRPGYLRTEYWENAGTGEGLWAFPAFRVRRSERAHQSAWRVWEKVKVLEKVAESHSEPLVHGVDKGEVRELREAIGTLSIADLYSPGYWA